ncbi:MAG: SurA N-terminal domain-containing protein [Thermosulfidibacteraceae bacterium]
MLDTIRNHARKFNVLIWVIVASFILSIFIVWGKGSFNPFSNWIIKIDKTEVSYEDFVSLFERLMELYRSQGINIDQNVQKEIKQQALEILITNTVIYDLAKRSGFTTSSKEITETLISIPDFVEKGKFSKEKYLYSLKNAGLTPARFEKNLQNELIIKKLQLTIKEGATLSDFELRKIATWNLIRGNIDCILVDLNKIKEKIPVDQNKVKEIYEKNKERYKTKEIINGIVIKVKPQNQNEKKEVLKKLELILKEAKDIKSLIELSKKYNIRVIEEDVLSDNDLEEILNNIKNLKENQISEIMKSKDYYVIVGIKNKKEPKPLTFEEAKPLIETEIRNSEIENYIKNLIDNTIKSKKDLQEVAKEYNSTLKTLNNISRGPVTINNESYKLLAIEALNKKEGEIGYVTENNKLVIFKVTKKTLPPEEDIENFMKNHKKNILNAKANKIWTALILDSRNHLKIEINKKFLGE